MLPNLLAVIGMMLNGAIAATALPAFSTLVALVTGPSSCISKDRKLSTDSDLRLLLHLVAIGATVGGLDAIVFGGGGQGIDILMCLVSFLAGLFYTLYRLNQLNSGYLKRARKCLTAGEYKNAIEDANEVARSSERLRGLAIKIRTEAERHRSRQPITVI